VHPVNNGPVSVLTLPYGGLPGGVERLTWGQKVLWRAVEAYVPGEAARSLAVSVPVPEGATGDDVAEAVRATVLRYETLRTTFRATPGGAVQEVAGGGRVELALLDAGADDLPAAFRQTVRSAAAIHFPVDAAQLQVSVLRCAGRPRVVVVGMSHLAVDAWGAQVVAGALGALLSGQEPGPARPYQPRHRVRWEGSEQGREAAAATVRHWREQLASCPPSLLAPLRRRSPRLQAVLHSATLPESLAALATRLRVTPPSCLLAALALALAAQQDQRTTHRFGCLATVGHRFPPLPPDYVGTAVHHSPVVFAVHPNSFPATARSAMPALLAAVRHAQADPDGIAAVLGEVQRRRRVAFEWVTVNIASRPGAPPPALDAADDVEHLPTGEAGSGPMELELLGGDLRVAVDPAALPRGQIGPFLRDVEGVLRAAALATDARR
jgi:hypothetical protein